MYENNKQQTKGECVVDDDEQQQHNRTTRVGQSLLLLTLRFAIVNNKANTALVTVDVGQRRRCQVK